MAKSSLAMEHSAKSVLSMPALGRPFALGMLYDARNDSLVPGISLWNNNELSENILRHNHNAKNNFEVDQGDTIRNRCSKFDMGVSLKLNFLAGLVSVGGSASFLYEGLAASTSERVTSHFSSVTHFEGLTMNHLGTKNITFPHLLSTNHATHVCVGIEYGAKAVLLFETEKTSSTMNNAAKGTLKASVSKLFPGLEVEGNGTCDLSRKEKMSLQNVTVKYYGDVKLDKAPTSFDDAAQALHQIPQKVNEDTAVALKVYLLPLSALSKSAAKVVEMAHYEVFDELEEITYAIDTAKQDVEKMLDSEVCKTFPELNTFLTDCHSHLRRKKVKFSAEVCRELVKYRSGESNGVSVFSSLLSSISGSFFDQRNISKWIDDQKHKLQLLHHLLAEIKFVTVEKNAAVFKTAKTFAKHCLVLSVEVGVQNFKDQIDHTKSDAGTSVEVSEDLRRLLWQFKEFLESNSDNDDAAYFVVVPGESKTAIPERITGSMTYYGRRSETKNYIPPSTPRNVELEAGINSATLRWHLPEDGQEHITGFEVHYRTKAARAMFGSRNERDFRSTVVDAGTTSWEVVGPPMTIPCVAKIRSLSSAGWSSWSPQVEVSMALPISVVNSSENRFLYELLRGRIRRPRKKNSHLLSFRQAP